MIEEPTLNTNKSGRSPWGQMCCFTPVILVPRQEDKKYKISLRDPVVIYFFMKEEGREEKKKRKNLLGRDVGQGRAWLLHWSALEICDSETCHPCCGLQQAEQELGPVGVHAASWTPQNQWLCHPLQSLHMALGQCHTGKTNNQTVPVEFHIPGRWWPQSLAVSRA